MKYFVTFTNGEILELQDTSSNRFNDDVDVLAQQLEVNGADVLEIRTVGVKCKKFHAVTRQFSQAEIAWYKRTGDNVQIAFNCLDEARYAWEDIDIYGNPGETSADYMPAIDNAIPPEDLKDMDEDLTAALMDPEEYLRKLDERLTIWGQDTAELDPAELWKGFGC